MATRDTEDIFFEEWGEESAVSGPAALNTSNGLAKASINVLCGVAIASVKSKNAVT